MTQSVVRLNFAAQGCSGPSKRENMSPLPGGLSVEALNILALSCFNVGEPFIRQARARGAKVWLLTEAKYLNKAWPRDLLEDVFAEPDASPLAHTINTVSFLSKKIRFDRIVPFDDIEVDVAASLREHLRMPG